MSNETLFFILGVILVLAALGLSFFGLRNQEFPPRPALLGAIGLFAALVVGTATFSVLNAEDEQEHRNAELAKEEEEAAAEPGAPGEKPPPSGGAPVGAATTLDVTSPEDGSTSFSPDGLEAPAGNITLTYDNPSPVSHNIAVELDGETLGESETVAGAVATLELTEVAPGEYVFFCTIQGHRQAGMEGDLTVTGPEKP